MLSACSPSPRLRPLRSGSRSCSAASCRPWSSYIVLGSAEETYHRLVGWRSRWHLTNIQGAGYSRRDRQQSAHRTALCRCHVVVWRGLIHFRCSAEGLATCSANPYLAAMETLTSWSPVPELEVNSVERREPGWLVAVDSRESASCPECGTQSSSRHSSYLRTLQDLSTQGTPVTIQARVTRWRCRNEQCGRRIFAERLPTLAAPFARRTARFAGIVRLFGHSTGGRPSERLLARLGMPVSDSTILRAVKERAAAQSSRAAARVIGIDEWAWRKGMNYGTIFVDLERRRVADLLADRTTATTADWFKLHPETEIVSRDRAGTAVLNATGSQRVGPLVRRRTPDRVRFATGRGFGRLIASHMTVFSGGAAVSSTRCRRERLGLSDLRAERRLRRSAGSA